MLINNLQSTGLTKKQKNSLKLSNNKLQPFYSPLDCVRKYRVSWYQKGKTNLDLLEQETMSGSGISWAICKSAPHPLTDNHASIPPLSFLQAGCPSCRPTNSVKALKALCLTKKQQQVV